MRCTWGSISVVFGYIVGIIKLAIMIIITASSSSSSLSSPSSSPIYSFYNHFKMIWNNGFNLARCILRVGPIIFQGSFALVLLCVTGTREVILNTKILCAESNSFRKGQREQFDCTYWPAGWEHLGPAGQTNMYGRSETDTKIRVATVSITCIFHPADQIITTVEFVTFSAYSHILV